MGAPTRPPAVRPASGYQHRLSIKPARNPLAGKLFGEKLFERVLEGTAVTLAPRKSDRKTQMINAGFVFDRVTSKHYCGYKHFPATETFRGGFSPVRAKGGGAALRE